MKKTKKAIATLAIAGMALTSIPFNVFAEGTVPTRLGGYTAAQTAVQIAEQTGWKGTAVLASVTPYGMVDALTAGPLATFLKAPILLQEAGQVLNPDTKAELIKLDVKTVYVTSGTAVISQAVLDQLTSMGIKVVPLGGVDRFETSVNIAKQMVALGANVSKVAIAYGWLSQDALSIASIASAQTQPILLTEKNKLPESVKAFLASNPSVTSTDVIGGTGVISNSVEAQLPNPSRQFGHTAYDTNVAVLKAFDSLLKYDRVFLANGETAIDALAGAPLAAIHNAGIVLTKGTANEGTTYVSSKLSANSVVTALGGTAVVPEAVLKGVVPVNPEPEVPVEPEKPGNGGGGGGNPGTPVVTTASVSTPGELTTALANQNITTITFTGNITKDLAISRSLTINFGTYVLTGSVSFDHISGGTSTLTGTAATSITGSLTVDTANASFVNNVVVGGGVNVVNVEPGTWTEKADGNTLTITDDDGSTITVEGSPGSITVTENAAGALTISVNAGATVGNITSNAPITLQVATGGTTGTVTANAPIAVQVAVGATVNNVSVGAGAGGSTISNSGTTGTVTANAPVAVQVAVGATVNNVNVGAGAGGSTISNSGTTGTVTANAPVAVQVAAGATINNVNVGAGAGGSTISNSGTAGTITTNAPVELTVGVGGTVTDINVEAGAGGTTIVNNGTTTNTTVKAGADGTTITNNGTATNVTTEAKIILDGEVAPETTNGDDDNIITADELAVLIDAVNTATKDTILVALQALAAISPLEANKIDEGNAANYVVDFAANPTTTVSQIRARVDAVNAAKKALKEAISAADSKDHADYTIASWSAVEAALTAAHVAFESETATIADLNSAATALTNAVNGLILLPKITATTISEATLTSDTLTFSFANLKRDSGITVSKDTKLSLSVGDSGTIGYFNLKAGQSNSLLSAPLPSNEDLNLTQANMTAIFNAIKNLESADKQAILNTVDFAKVLELVKQAGPTTQDLVFQQIGFEDFYGAIRNADSDLKQDILENMTTVIDVSLNEDSEDFKEAVEDIMMGVVLQIPDLSDSQKTALVNFYLSQDTNVATLLSNLKLTVIQKESLLTNMDYAALFEAMMNHLDSTTRANMFKAVNFTDLFTAMKTAGVTEKAAITENLEMVMNTIAESDIPRADILDALVFGANKRDALFQILKNLGGSSGTGTSTSQVTLTLTLTDGVSNTKTYTVIINE